MARYLVVAHQTANSAELMESLLSIAASDKEAEFTILVPATPVAHLLEWEEGETLQIAERVAQDARAAFVDEGLRVADALVGDGSPLQAIEDEYRENPGKYRAIVLSTLPPNVSRWLHMDVQSQAERKFGSRVIHVIARPVARPKL